MTTGNDGSAFVDRFVLDRLPPRDLWPWMDRSGVPELTYPAQLNCTTVLLDERIAAGEGDRVVFHHEAGAWSYRRLHETANRIASVLVDELGLVPGGRVLLRGANHPMLVACWFAVLRAGGVAVTTMPLLRPRELTEIVERADVAIALTDAGVAADLPTLSWPGPTHPLVCIPQNPNDHATKAIGRPYIHYLIMHLLHCCTYLQRN